MPYFKDKNGGLHFLSAEDIANGAESLLPSGCTPISDAEAEAIQNPPLSTQQLLSIAKSEREKQVAGIVVTTKAGHTYQGDKDSQLMMGAYLSAMTDQDVIPWVLVDNSVVKISKAELTEALRLAGAQMAQIWPAIYK